MYLEFMKPAVWDGIVVAITVIGLGLAILQLRKNRAGYRQSSDK